MASERTPMMSVEEYLELEENSPDTRYEYLDDYVYTDVRFTIAEAYEDVVFDKDEYAGK